MGASPNGDRAELSVIILAAADGSLLAHVDPVGARIAAIIDTASGRNVLFTPPWSDEDYTGQFPDADSNVEWHRRYPGGWHVLIPHVGDAVTIDGVAHPFHGEAAWRPWRVTDATPDGCTLSIVLRTAPLDVTRTVRMGPARVEVTQSVHNYSGETAHFSWTEHPTLGEALIDPQTSIRVGGRPVDVRIPPKPERFSGMTTVDSPQDGSFEVTNPVSGLVVSSQWDPAVFPVVSIWQEHRDSDGAPWWNTVDALAPEPSSRHYLLDSDTLGPLALGAGETMTTTISLSVAHLPER